GQQLMPEKLVYNYPNPTEGNSTTIRYTLNSPAQVRIKIYDLAGQLVDELQGTGFGQAENEVIWGLENIESGVYLAHVEADGDGNKGAAIIKIAVVK
ncbi:MAG: T9SS type A sorting domain-containing protein, partial [Caldithrix sp.]